MALLTTARRALWDAINAWSELRDPQDSSRSLFRLKFDWEADQPLIVEAEPSISDFPAIEIIPSGGVSTSYVTNVAQEWGLSLDVKVWTHGWSLPDVEELAEKIARAIFQAAPDASTVSYVKAAVGLHPRLAGISITAVRLRDSEGDDEDLVTATLLRLTIVLPTRFNPFTAPA